MDLRIADLKVGAKLVFGNYGVTDRVHPITWLKANKECEFISEFVLDLLAFDYRERTNPNRDINFYGNSDYELSNIVQFMNSWQEDWYSPTHDLDEPPGMSYNQHRVYGQYANHPGFLYDFHDYEIESLASRISLPSTSDIFGSGAAPRLPLFNRKGYRGRPHEDVVLHYPGMSESSFCDFWLRDAHSACSVDILGRSGSKQHTYATCYSGLRPKCTINPETKVEPLDDGSGFRVIPFEVDTPIHRRTNVCTDEEFLALMGLL